MGDKVRTVTSTPTVKGAIGGGHGGHPVLASEYPPILSAGGQNGLPTPDVEANVGRQKGEHRDVEANVGRQKRKHLMSRRMSVDKRVSIAMSKLMSADIDANSWCPGGFCGSNGADSRCSDVLSTPNGQLVSEPIRIVSSPDQLMSPGRGAFYPIQPRAKTTSQWSSARRLKGAETDGDGLRNLGEFAVDTNPRLIDTDGGRKNVADDDEKR